MNHPLLRFSSPLLWLRASLLFSGALALAPLCQAESLGWNADVLVGELASIGQLPAVPEGVEELKFAELFKLPVGPAGLEFSDRARRLDGRRVRLLGFMVKQEQGAPGVAMLAPFAATTHEEEYGLCDDLPPALVFIEVPNSHGAAVPYTPGPLLLTGRLELGRREESDERVSHVRLVLDAAPASAAMPAGAPNGQASHAAR